MNSVQCVSNVVSWGAEAARGLGVEGVIHHAVAQDVQDVREILDAKEALDVPDVKDGPGVREKRDLQVPVAVPAQLAHQALQALVEALQAIQVIPV